MYQICSNCGADEGLHHYSTQQCPKNGIEEWRDGKKQEWQDTVFYPIDKKRLEDAAPKLLDALKVCFASLCTYSSHPIIEKQVNDAIHLAEK